MMTPIHDAARLWWGWMGPMFWQAGLFILIVWGIDRLIRRWAWPQLCYALWLLVLLKLVCPPWLASPTSLTAGLFNRQALQPQAVYEPPPESLTPPNLESYLTVILPRRCPISIHC